MNYKKEKNVFRTMISVSGIVVLAKILGFLKQMVTANAFGATIQTDLISISEGLVTNIDYLLVQTLAIAFIPTYINIKTNEPEKTRHFVSNVIKVFLLITVAIGTVVLLAAPLIAKILAPSYSDELSLRLTGYVRIFAPVLILIVELAIFNALLKANESFIPGELIGVNQSVILIALVIIIGGTVGPNTIVVAFYVYALFNLIFLMVCSRKLWILSSGNPFKDSSIKNMLSMMGPLLLGYSVVFINQQVDKIIVSGLGEGTITAMNYAAVLSNFISTFTGSLCGVLFTYITKHVAEKREEDAARLTMQSASQMITLLLPISILTVLNARDIVTIVFGHGKFDSTAIQSCSLALIGYGFTFVPFVLRELYSRFQYAYGDSKRPMINSTIAIIFNIVFSILLSKWFGVLGVTFATSISVLVCGILNMKSSFKRNNYLSIRSLFSNLPALILGLIACVIVTLIGQHYLSTLHIIIRFVSITFVSLCIYFIINYKTIFPLIRNVLKK